jgi:hypothetical protein
MITLKPGFIANVTACRRGPPPAREMPKPSRPAELAHRHRVLEPDPRTCRQRHPPPGAADINELQPEPGNRRLPTLSGSRHRHHTEDDPDLGKIRWQDTPDEQDSLTRRKINCHRTRGMQATVDMTTSLTVAAHDDAATG